MSAREVRTRVDRFRFWWRRVVHGFTYYEERVEDHGTFRRMTRIPMLWAPPSAVTDGEDPK